MNSHELITRLRARYSPPEYAFFEEVGDRTGGRSRSADGLAMSLWPSRGLEVYGFEVKVSRQDWTRELKNPAKAESIARFCDRWWLVVSDPKIVQTGELPPTWGLLVPKGGDGLTVAVEASKLEAQPLARPFVGAVLRAAQKEAPAEVALKRARDEGFEAGVAEGTKRAKTDRDFAVRNAEQLAEQVAAFEAASGVKIEAWNGKRIGKAVAKVLELYNLDHRRQIEGVVEHLDRVRKELTAALKVTADIERERG